MMSFFIAIQSLLFLFMIFHDWVNLPPFTDLAALRKAHSFKERLLGLFVNGTLVLVPLVVALAYRQSSLPFWASIMSLGLYGLMTFGTIAAWWIPYFGGSYLIHGEKAGFEEYRNTHSFLPPRNNHVTPNTLHIILHLQVWICFGISLYWLFIHPENSSPASLGL